MSDEILDEIRRLRKEIEVQTAINVIEGVHTIETLVALGHWMRKQRPPTAREAEVLEVLARDRWAAQVKHTMGLLRAENTDLDEKMTALAELLAEEKRPPKRTRPRRKKRRATTRR
jgi:hypothetical protein